MRKTHIFALLWVAVLGVPLSTVSHAQNQQFPPTLPPNTVYGRLGAGVPGPAQAIPFSTLSASLIGTRTVQCTNSAADVTNLNAALALGGEVRPIGTCMVGASGGSAVSFTVSGTWLHGYGKGQTVFLMPASSSFTGNLVQAIGNPSLTDIRVSDLTIDGHDNITTPPNGSMIMAQAVTGLSVDHVQLSRMYGTAGITYQAVTNFNISDSDITLTTARSTQNQCILATSALANNSGTILNNNCINSGMDLSAANAMIAYNTISGFKFGLGIVTEISQFCYNLTINGNAITGGGTSLDSNNTMPGGIEHWCPDSTVSNNIFNGNGGDGFDIGGYNNTVVGNISYDNGTGAGGGFNGAYARFGTAASFTGAISGTTLTVTGSCTGGALGPRAMIFGSGVTQGTIITADVSGSGCAGTYTVNFSQSVGSEAMTWSVGAQGSVFANNVIFNTAGSGGPQIYSYNEQSSSLFGITLSGNSFGPGSTGTTNILSSTTGFATPATAAHSIIQSEANSPVKGIAAATAGNIIVDQGSSSDWLSKTVSGDCTLAGSGAITCTKTNGTAFNSGATVGRYKLGQQHVPFVYPSSGTMGNNGAFSAITAVPHTYPSAYCYFPLHAISSGSAAGWYYCTFSGTTAGTVFNNTYTSGTPTIPGSPTSFSTTGPGAYTQTTGSFIQAYTLTIPGNTIGPNGTVWLAASGYATSSANTKTQLYQFGGSLNVAQNNITTSGSTNSLQGFANLGVTNLQGAISNLVSMSTTGTASYGTIDTTSSQTVAAFFNDVSASDTNVIESLDVELAPGVP